MLNRAPHVPVLRNQSWAPPVGLMFMEGWHTLYVILSSLRILPTVMLRVFFSFGCLAMPNFYLEGFFLPAFFFFFPG